MTTYAAALADARATLTDAAIADAAVDARLLLAAAAGLDMAALIARAAGALPDEAAARFQAYIRRRKGGEPVARILGVKEFWGLPFELDAATLVPRPETETLVQAVLDELGARRSEPFRLLDLGTGSGCILAALLQECLRATGRGIDADPAAVATARRNLSRLGLDARATVRQGDWLAGVAAADVIVSNPPYVADGEIAGLPIEVREFDPHAALKGGADGLDAYRAIVADLGRVLAAGGIVAFEVGAGQAQDVARLMRSAGVASVRAVNDLAGIERVVVGRSNPFPSC